MALPPELEEKYAAACENATALAKEKADAEEECSRLRRHALELEEQAAVAMAELKVRWCPIKSPYSYRGCLSELRSTDGSWTLPEPVRKFTKDPRVRAIVAICTLLHVCLPSRGVPLCMRISVRRVLWLSAVSPCRGQ